MEISFLGHASFRIKSKENTVVTDPFDPEMVGFKFSQVSANIVTVSHEHSDHNRVDLVSGVEKVIRGPGEYEIAGVSIIGSGSFHDESKGSERGPNIIYVIEIEGMRVVHLGDLGHQLSEKLIGEIGEVDVLMIPVGGVYTIGPKQAVEVVNALSPKIILPMHYQTSDLNSASFTKLCSVDEFLSLLSIKVEKRQKLTLRKETIPVDEQLVILLEKK
jgi:L-ascorbate metabolism protein UlaG (beta-lactamase superfamily)